MATFLFLTAHQTFRAEIPVLIVQSSAPTSTLMFVDPECPKGEIPKIKWTLRKCVWGWISI